MSWKVIKLEKLRRELRGYNQIIEALFGGLEVTDTQLAALSPVMQSQAQKLLCARTEAQGEREKLEEQER